MSYEVLFVRVEKKPGTDEEVQVIDIVEAGWQGKAEIPLDAKIIHVENDNPPHRR